MNFQKLFEQRLHYWKAHGFQRWLGRGSDAGVCVPCSVVLPSHLMHSIDHHSCRLGVEQVGQGDWPWPARASPSLKACRPGVTVIRVPFIFKVVLIWIINNMFILCVKLLKWVRRQITSILKVLRLVICVVLILFDYFLVILKVNTNSFVSSNTCCLMANNCSSDGSYFLCPDFTQSGQLLQGWITLVQLTYWFIWYMLNNNFTQSILKPKAKVLYYLFASAHLFETCRL